MKSAHPLHHVHRAANRRKTLEHLMLILFINSFRNFEMDTIEMNSSRNGTENRHVSIGKLKFRIQISNALRTHAFQNFPKTKLIFTKFSSSIFQVSKSQHINWPRARNHKLFSVHLMFIFGKPKKVNFESKLKQWHEFYN